MKKLKTLSPSALVEWRKRNDYTQIKLGKVLGVSTITVYRWEKGMREVPSFLHLALKYLETKGGGAWKKKSKGVTKTNIKGGKKHGKSKRAL